MRLLVLTSIALVTFNDKISAFVHNYVRNIRNDKECGKVTRLGKFQDDRCCNIKSIVLSFTCSIFHFYHFYYLGQRRRDRRVWQKFIRRRSSIGKIVSYMTFHSTAFKKGSKSKSVRIHSFVLTDSFHKKLFMETPVA